MEGVGTGFAFALLLTSIWERPGAVAAYFLFFFVVEVVVARLLLPPGAFGSGFAFLCLGLTVPVWIATFLVWRQEKRENETE